MAKCNRNSINQFCQLENIMLLALLSFRQDQMIKYKNGISSLLGRNEDLPKSKFTQRDNFYDPYPKTLILFSDLANLKFC